MKQLFILKQKSTNVAFVAIYLHVAYIEPKYTHELPGYLYFFLPM